MVRVPVLSLLLVIAMTVTAGETMQTSGSGQDVVSASTLKRTHTVMPAWPESAAAGVEAWVLLRFTLQPNGSVTDIEVTGSSPAGVFEASAVQALRQWRFEAVERDGGRRSLNARRYG